MGCRDVTMTPLQNTRIEIIDVLRGFALLGIAWVHFTEQYLAGIPPQSHSPYNSFSLADEIVSGVVGILIAGKFFTIFSFLFGLSFELQIRNREGRSSWRFAWRLLLLLGIGWVHHLHYRGDILTIYAMLGFVLLLAQRLPDRWVFVLALLLVLDVPAVGMRFLDFYMLPAPGDATVNPFTGQTDADNLAYWNAVTSGDYLALLRANAEELINKYRFQIGSGRIFITLGLFLLGMLAGRRKLFADIASKREVFRKLLKLSLWALLATVLFAVAFFGSFYAAGIELPQSVQWAVGGFAYDAFNAAMALLYMSALVLLWLKEKWRQRLRHFYAVGRMGLTTYLVQSAVGVVLFFGVGFNLLGKMGAGMGFLIGTLLFVFQILLSQWWLKRYTFGPVEWLWRTLTYGQWQAFRKT